jgi:hypothetical protein
MTMRRTLVMSAWALLGLSVSARAQLPAGTSFTYQGRLEDAGSPATGSYDFEFRLFAAAAGGTQVGGTVARPGVAVAAGLFTADLDFGDGVFTGDALWLEVAVRPAGSGAFTTLSPRQRATGAPYAIHALSIPLAGSGTATTAARSDHDHAGTYAASVHTHDAADLATGTIAPARVDGAYGGITGVGTLGTGTWNGTAIGALFGGTGQTSWTTGDLLFGAASNTPARLPVGTTGQVLSVASGVPAWASADAHDHLGQLWSTSEHLYALNLVNNSPTGISALRAARGGTAAVGGTAIDAINTQSVLGSTAIRGEATDASVINFGVYGSSSSSNGRGVVGVATATSGQPVGVFGQAGSPTGWGFFTQNNSFVGGNLRVGLAGVPSARLDVVGQARIEAASGLPPILVPTPYAAGASVANLSADLLDGLDSSAFAPDAHDHAGDAWSATSGPYGLTVMTTSAASAAALRGINNGAGFVGWGVEGINNQSGAGAAGVFGVTSSPLAINYGVLGRTQSVQGIGVRGEASVTSGDAWGVFGTSLSSAGRGVVGSATATSGVTYGVYGSTSSTDGWGLYTPGRAHVGSGFTVAGPSVLTGQVAIGGAVTSARLSIVPSSLAGVRELEFTGGVLQAVEVLANNNMLIGTATASDLQLQTGLTTRLIIGATGQVGIGTGAPSARLDVEQSGLPVAEFNRTTSDGAVINIAQDGVVEGNISVTGTTVSYNAFTGSHYAWTDDSIERGMLVSMTGENRRLYGREGAEPIHGIVPSTRANDPAVLGAYLGRLEPSQPERPATDNPHLVAAVGNGELWVVDAGGDIEPGDPLIASSTPGHATRDDDRFDVSHVVARAAERVRWRDVGDRGDGTRRRLIPVLFESHARESTSALRSALDRSTRELAELRLILAAQSSRLEVLEVALASERGNLHRAAVRPLARSER